MSSPKPPIVCPRCQSTLQVTSMVAMTFCPTCVDYLDNILSELKGVPYSKGRALAARYLYDWKVQQASAKFRKNVQGTAFHPQGDAMSRQVTGRCHRCKVRFTWSAPPRLKESDCPLCHAPLQATTHLWQGANLIKKPFTRIRRL